jgi:tetratricopeptide (TPR) repeat protein
MSHTIGQAKQDNQQSNLDSHQLEPGTSSSTPKLSDADYEFLFNQLLEGIAHGWHDHRIIKFFQQLGDRGKQSDWIDWLNRTKVELLKLPIQSKRQLGTIMIRLGELTQSAVEVNQIGAASNSIGRELLFGNSATVIWEYVGPDLTPKAAPSEAGKQELSERLPTDFTALGAGIESSDAELVDQSADFSLTEASIEEPANSSPGDRNRENSLNSSTQVDSPNLTEVRSYSEEFEFELPSKSLDNADDLVADSWEMVSEVEQPVEQDLELSVDAPKLELSEAIDALDNEPIDQSLSFTETDPTAIDMKRVMHLIQSDEELAQQISQKLISQNLNVTSAQPGQGINELDESSLELVESWFNLGLKHVSAGEFAKAIADWEKALDINPNLSEAWHNRGSALGRLGNYEAAVESFQNALTIDSNNYQAWNDRAHALYQLQNWLEAVDSWSNAIKIVPGNHLFWYNRGCALEQLEKWQEAIASYEKALEIKPDFQPGRSRYINLVADNSRTN